MGEEMLLSFKEQNQKNYTQGGVTYLCKLGDTEDIKFIFCHNYQDVQSKIATLQSDFTKSNALTTTMIYFMSFCSFALIGYIIYKFSI